MPLSGGDSGDVQRLQDIEAKLGLVPQYVSQTRMHWADAVAAYPATADNRGKLVLIDDLYGSMDWTLRCATDGTNFFWIPNGLPEYFKGTMSTATDMVLTALGSPTIVPLTGTIGALVTRKVTLSTDYVWPGARKRVLTSGVTSILGTLQILSGVTSILNLALGNKYDFAVDWSGGAPQWVQI